LHLIEALLLEIAVLGEVCGLSIVSFYSFLPLGSDITAVLSKPFSGEMVE